MVRIVDTRTCPKCGIENRSTTHDDNVRCTDCGASLVPPEPVADQPIAWSGTKAIEEGATAIREHVAKMRQRR